MEAGRNLLVFNCSYSTTELFFIGTALGGLAIQFQRLYCEPSKDVAGRLQALHFSKKCQKIAEKPREYVQNMFSCTST